MKLPVHAFPRIDVGLVVIPGEDKVPQVSFICKDRIMESDGVKTLVLNPEHFLCLLHDAGGSQDTLIGRVDVGKDLTHTMVYCS